MTAATEVLQPQIPNNPCTTPTHARGVFHGPFYGLENFRCKNAQFCATRRESEFPKHLASATVREPVKTHAKTLS